MRVFLFAAISLMCLAGSASAQPKSNAAELFEEGRALMQAGLFGQAHLKLEESFRLEPAIGTILNIAFCHDQLGRLATAYRWYEKVIDLAARSNQTARAVFARERLTRLGADAPRIIIRMARSEPPVVATLEGVPVPVGEPHLLDAGVHELLVYSPGYQPWKIRVVAVDGRQISIEVPPLVAEVLTARAIPVPQLTPSIEARPRLAFKSYVGFGLGGAGLVGLSGGLLFVWKASSTRSDAESLCGAGAACAPEDRGRKMKLIDDARAQAKRAAWLWSIGGAAAIAGAALLFTAPWPRHRKAARLAPTTYTRGAGLVFTGRF